MQPLQNVLSISTAGKNRYLLHFNSLHSLTQWTAGIRLAMFEHASLQELYTGSLIAGKGKHLNNIRVIMERTKFRHEDWARVRFGAGTPWRRCWCVIEPPDEKEWQRATKSMKKRTAYERPVYPKGDIKFYDTKKITKKTVPIATITDAYSAYAIYPQSRALIDQSTLVKLEGKITIHSTPESKTEGFVFVMPEVHPAVTGFEMMLRWLFPVYDIFQLYGRPTKLIADTLDAKGLMFAMPQERRYGYLDIIDVAALIHGDGSEKWSEREWRKQLKEMTARRISSMRENRTSSTLGTRNGPRLSMGSRTGVQYADDISVRSTPSSRQGHQPNMSTDAVFATPRKATAPQAGPPLNIPAHNYHQRSASESVVVPSPSKARRQNSGYQSSRLSMDQADSPEPMDPAPVLPTLRNQPYKNGRPSEIELPDSSRNSSDTELQIQRTQSHAEEVHQNMRQQTPPGPVAPPPTFHHQATDKPARRPDGRPEMRREKSRMSNATLEQFMQASRPANGNTNGNGNGDVANTAAALAWNTGNQRQEQPTRGVGSAPNNSGTSANQASKAMVATGLTVPRSANMRPTETRQVSSTSIAEESRSRSTSQHSIKRKPIPAVAPPLPAPMMRGISNDQTSNYSNPERQYESDESPDYASTRKSEDTRSEKSVPRARTGVLKTVGTPNVDSGPEMAPRADIPDIDFGVTQSLTPGASRPGTAMGRASPLGFSGQSTPEPRVARTPEYLPSDEKRASYFGRTSPMPGHSRSPSYAWQPTTGRQSPGPTLSPEEFVQQRSRAAARPQGHAPQRSISTGQIEQVAAGPKKLQKSRTTRPSSRNSGTLLDFSGNLSAREQEHVARMTGGPLLNLPERNRTPDRNVGLIGAIGAREQEKRNMRDGVSGHMVQAAIASQQQQQQQQAQAQAQQMYASQAAQRAYHQQQYGQYAQPQYGQQQYGQQQYAQQPYYQQQHPQNQYTSWGAPMQPTRSAPTQQPQYPNQGQYPVQQQRPPQQQLGNPGQPRYYQNQQQDPQRRQDYGGYYQ